MGSQPAPLILSWLGMVVLMGAAGSVAAAESMPEEAGLAEIIVTAQRRAESSQNVPVAIQAFDEAALKSMGVTSTEDLPEMVPGMTLQASGASRPIFLRGVGNNNNSNVGSAVLVFIDGVYYPYQQGNLPYNNVASVEIDKGPQGTLFGRNATGGVIQITTKDPSYLSAANVDLGWGHFDTQSASLYAATGLTDKLAADISVYYLNQKDGWGHNLATGQEVYQNKNVDARSKWLFKATDGTEVRLALDYLTSYGSVGTTVDPAVGHGFLFNEVTREKFTI